ncbi:MAG: hypothetical protein A2Y40_08360 [Candidatus Margulisbacteria bacterium GWF2_35_9]|nr:MAG: hypothetical protein A2Y40_08360 [Candidatus Margulisbacteria bacterium GWF2_35_9]
MFYKKVFNVEASYKQLIFGAIFVTTSMAIFNIVFGYFIVYIASSFNKTYGTISSIILLLLWFQINALFILMGSNIVMLNQNKHLA